MNRERFDSILDTAVALIDHEGEAALGWNRVAQALGVKPPSLYNHFDNIQSLRKHVALRGWVAFADEATQGCARARSPEGSLRAIANAYRALAKARPGLFAVMNTTQIALDDRDFAPIAARLLTLFDEPLEALGVSAANRVHAIRAMRSAIHGFVHLESAGQFAMDANVDRSFQWLIETFVKGVLE